MSHGIQPGPKSISKLDLKTVLDPAGFHHKAFNVRWVQRPLKSITFPLFWYFPNFLHLDSVSYTETSNVPFSMNFFRPFHFECLNKDLNLAFFWLLSPLLVYVVSSCSVPPFFVFFHACRYPVSCLFS